ncbi:MAG TPA: hypothetical protein DEQ34_09280 [Balneolaceae bacterium]|nr:hypothetical protein [Balneolaceae bacterium]
MITTIACNRSLVVERVNYSQPVESVITPTDDGIIQNRRYGITFSILPIQYEELRDTSNVLVDEVRMIRDQNGFYYITASGFNHVYVMKPGTGELKLEKKISIGDQQLISPAFNWRSPVVQLIDLDQNKEFYLNHNGIIKGEDQS